MNNPISLHTEEVLKAIKEVEWDWGNMCPACPKEISAAAIRAAVNQVLPEDECDYGSTQATQRLIIRRLFLKIASELDPPL